RFLKSRDFGSRALGRLSGFRARSKFISCFKRLSKWQALRPRWLAKLALPLQERVSGEMAEWLKAHAWKACVRETVPWVRIPLSPPYQPKPYRTSEWRLASKNRPIP